MPRISTFYGIVIAIYYDDHAPPHFHAIYSGEEAVVSELEANVSRRPARVRSVEVLGDRRVRLTFTDDVEREVDLAPLLWGSVFEEIRLDDDVFRAVTVDLELGTMVWPNGADIDPDVLHGDASPLRQPTSGA
jgi:hypothetical protein